MAQPTVPVAKRSLDEFIEAEIANRSYEVKNIRESIEDQVMMFFDNNDSLGVPDMKNIIWFSADWPSFIDPGDNTFISLVDRYVSDEMSIELIRLLTGKLPVDFNPKKNELTLRETETSP